jgi:uncharacterized membrane protein YbhN (UPF0104 family)
MPVKAVSITIVLGLLVYLAMASAWTDWATVMATVQDLTPTVWLQVGALALLSYGVRFARWHLLISSLGHRLPLGRHLTIYLSAFALALTPAKVGETVRSFYLYPMGVSYPNSLSAFVVERLIDLLVVCALASLILFFFVEHSAWLMAVGLMSLTVTALSRSHLFTWLSTRWLKGSAAQYLSEATMAARQLLRIRNLVQTAPLTALAWTAQGLGLALVSSALGSDLAWHWSIAIYSLSLLAGAASFIPGGLGATEAAMVLLLMAAGLDLTTATSAALVARGVPLWLAIALGVLSMLKLSQKPVTQTNST